MKRRALILAAGLLVCLQGACEGGGPGRYMSIGTGGTGGIYYPVGGALASMLSNRFPDRQFTAEVTAASVENVTRLQQGQIDLGMAITITILGAYEGTAQVNEPFEELRIVAPLWPNPVNILIPEGSEIDDFGDVRGQRLGVGAPGSGTEQVSRALLDAYGMSYEDVEERFLSFSESSAGIRDGSLDAAVLEVAYPAAAVMEATTTGNAQLLPLEGPEIDTLL
ncbi:MAG: TAXI family TRAP transporter solute-binding subunit, partial [Longimicrobiales bacterium]|nr:TAXI family TRAP transporter solute-binding subunit [Longimicrobiales bacterium]